MDVELLAKMIRTLVTDHDMVGLKGVGSFVAELMPASFSDKGYTLNPPYRKLSFVPQSSDDGLLAQLYSKTNSVPIEFADEIISQFLGELHQVLKDSKTIILPGLGRLRATRENNLFFVADPELDIFPDGYALEPISLRSHSSDQRATEITFSFNPALKKTPSADTSEDEAIPVEQSHAAELGSPQKAASEQLPPIDDAVESSEVSSEKAEDNAPAEYRLEFADSFAGSGSNAETASGSEATIESDSISESGEEVPTESQASVAEEAPTESETTVEEGAALTEEAQSESISESREEVSTESQASVVEEAPTESEATVEEEAALTEEAQSESENGTPADTEPETEQVPVPVPEAETEPESEPEPEPKTEPEPEPDSKTEPEPITTQEPILESPQVKAPKKSFHWWAPVLILLFVAIMAFLVFITLAQVNPDFTDTLLYTPEELQILNY